MFILPIVIFVFIHKVLSDTVLNDSSTCPARCDFVKELDVIREEMHIFRQLLNQESLIRMNLEEKIMSQEKLIENMLKEINFVKRATEDQISETKALQSEVHQMIATFNDSVSSHKEETRDIAFTVSTSSHLRYYDNKKIIYDKVITNEGDAYNSTTGVFTCPSPGTYVFTWSTMSRTANEPCFAHIFHNGIKLLQSYSNEDNNGGNEVASNTIVLSLTLDDRVWVQTEKGTFCAGYSFTAFSGWQI